MPQLTSQMISILLGIIGVFLITSLVLTIFIPFWVMQIRNEVLAINRNLEQLVRLIGGDEAVTRKRVP